MGYVIHEETERGYTLKIEMTEYVDEHDNPRKNQTNLSTMVCEHRNYILGDTTLRDLTGYDTTEFHGMAHLKRYIQMRFKPLAFTWLGLIDHSGISMYAGGGAHWSDSAGWDSGTVGFAIVLPEDQKITGAPPEDCHSQMLNEIEEYDAYLRGEVYEWTIEDHDGEFVDSCCGYLGSEYVTEDATRTFRDYLASIPEQLQLEV